MTTATLAEVTAWLDGPSPTGGDYTLRAEVGVDASFSYDDDSFASVLDGLIVHAEQTGRFLPPGTGLFLVADSGGIASGGIVVVDVKVGDRTVRVASFYQEWKHLTDDREAVGDAAAAAILSSISDTAEAAVASLRAVLPA